MGIQESSPYGEQAYRVTDVKQGSVTYTVVIYEFMPDSGMQFVLAEFPAPAAAIVFNELMRTLGPAEQLGAANLSPSSDAVWRAREGVMIQYQGSRYRLILFGPLGAPLRPELDLRDEAPSGMLKTRAALGVATAGR